MNAPNLKHLFVTCKMIGREGKEAFGTPYIRYEIKIIVLIEA